MEVNFYLSKKFSLDRERATFRDPIGMKVVSFEHGEPHLEQKNYTKRKEQHVICSYLVKVPVVFCEVFAWVHLRCSWGYINVSNLI